jgi:hypothetical protein
MKLAHFIMVHKDPAQISRLVKQLLTEDCDIYLHVDKKVNDKPFRQLLQNSRVKFIAKRVDVVWGGFSQIRATINGIKEIFNSGATYHYINFISGQDYPIKKISDFYRFLNDHNGKEFIEFHPPEERPEVTKLRFFKYHLSDSRFKGRYLIQVILNTILKKKEFPIKDFKLVWKAQWFTITPDAAKYVIGFLEDNPKVERFFRYCWGVDELVFQSVLYNSHFKLKLYNDNLKYIVWIKGNASPQTLSINDFDSISQSGKFFARKFDAKTDESILDKIDNEILNLK